MAKPRPRTIDVEIYDQKYSIVLKSDIQESDVRKIADDVDERMREISAVANTPDSLKIAVLTALHLAQELRELKRSSEQNEVIIRRKSDEWTHALEQLLQAPLLALALPDMLLDAGLELRVALDPAGEPAEVVKRSDLHRVSVAQPMREVVPRRVRHWRSP